jgi:hypothetical protein
VGFDRLGTRGLILPIGARCRDLRQPKVKDLSMATLGYEDVGGLNVSVHNALGVGRVESIGNLDGQRQQRFQLQRPTPDQVL